MSEAAENLKQYVPLPTLRAFHESGAQIRCVVGPVGSGKTSAATWEICYYLPQFLFEEYKMKNTRWVVVRNTYPELRDTTMRTVFDWFPWGQHKKQENIYILNYPEGFTAEILFRSCDNPDDVKKFKSLEVTGYWIDESIEVAEEIKRMLKNRIGRYPRKSLVRFGIETTNPPDVEHPTYSDFKWMNGCPGPMQSKEPLENHEGFWQPPKENVANLRPGYYDDLKQDYRDNKDWIATYIDGMPGIVVQGKLVYNNFKRNHHVSVEHIPCVCDELWRGWDHSGNMPACVVLQIPSARRVHILAEFHNDKIGIVDFAKMVQMQCNLLFPNVKKYMDWGDPAGEAKYSKAGGGFTSNSMLISEATGIQIIPSEQNWEARKESVESQLNIIDGLLIDPSCIRLINGFIGGYHYKEIYSSIGQYADKPEKNRFSHIHEALQYVMVRVTGDVMQQTDTEKIKQHMQANREDEWSMKSWIRG